MRAVFSIKINFNETKEHLLELRNIQPLVYGNKRLYSNLFPNLIERYSPNVVILDVGALDGWFARVVYRFSSKGTKVISFEPQKSMLHHLENLSKKMPNYSYENIALGETESEVELKVYETQGL